MLLSLLIALSGPAQAAPPKDVAPDVADDAAVPVNGADVPSDGAGVTAQPRLVFRTRNADGVVEFNDYGVGEPIELEVVPPADAESARLVGQRVLDIEALALEMADDRIAREAARDERLALARERLARERARPADAFTDPTPLYYPLRVPGFRRPFGRFDRWGRGRSERRAPQPPMAPAEPPSQRISDLPLSP